ncbi:Cytochrome c oxidase subunit 9, mitochondrial [Mycena kentingensis (nom. inval.)]|nr:Cytochrome c oxidase subunit 9, mitochondrial [Mycena kentingensis (nom. inval.)]
MFRRRPRRKKSVSRRGCARGGRAVQGASGDFDPATLFRPTSKMPVAPITGMLRKRFWLDISTGLGLGVSAGAAWWYGYELPSRTPALCSQTHHSSSSASLGAHREAFYLKLEKEKLAAQQ